MNRSLIIAALMLGGACSALISTPALAQDVDFTQSLAQSKLLIKQNNYREAIKELRKALSTAEGDKNFEAHFLYAQATFRNHDIAQAIDFAQRAVELAANDVEKQQAQDFYTYLSTAFGKVEIVPGEGELPEGYIILSPMEPLLDPDVKRYYDEKVVPLFTQKRSLPFVYWLPAIAYRFNEQEFTVKPGEVTEVKAGFTPERVAALAADAEKLQRKADQDAMEELGFLELRPGTSGISAELKGGMTFVLGQPAGTLTAPAVDLTLRKELGRVGAAVFGTLALTSVDVTDPRSGYSGTQTGTDFITGALATLRVWLPGGLSLIPGLGLAYGTAAGYLAYCDVATSELDEATNTLTYSSCAVTSDGMSDPSVVHLQSRGVGPAGRMNLVYEKKTGLGYVGAHLDLSADMLLAHPPESASREAEPYSQEVVFAEAGSSMVTRVGAMVGVNLAF